MSRFLASVGESQRVNEVLDASVRWGVGLAANMHLPDPSLSPDQPDLPVALWLHVDRLDCPSRLVQERAAWSLAELLANPVTCDETKRALLTWHKRETLELSSCILLLILGLSHTAHGTSVDTCLDTARQANLEPSIGTDLLLREFGSDGASFAATLNYRTQHSERPNTVFAGVEDFELIVGAHLAPIFYRWADSLDRLGIAFLRQWKWESVQLTRQQGLSLRLNAHFNHHYRRGVDDPALAISDRLSAVLRSAYLRALHWAIDENMLDVNRAEYHAKRVAIMADPGLWAVRPSELSDWWPKDMGDVDDRLDALPEAVSQAVRDKLERRQFDEDVLLFAAGPVGNRSHLRAELMIRAFLQSAHGPLNPPPEYLARVPWTNCTPTSSDLLVAGSYINSNSSAGFICDWFVAPLAWRFHHNAENWLLPDRQTLGVYVPATWIFTGVPELKTTPECLRVVLGDQEVARYRHWHDNLHERHYQGAGTRAGGELTMRREWLTPHLARGATLCWLVTLSVAQRDEYENHFREPQVVGTWVFGGSQIIRPEPWRPSFSVDHLP